MRSRTGSRVGLHVAPMIDIVFLLLIYFMVATDFSPAEEVFRLDLPAVDGGKADPLNLLEMPLHIELKSAGADGRLVHVSLDGPWSPPGTIEGLRHFLDNAIAPRGSLFVADHPVIILASKEVHWQHIVEAFNTAVLAGCTNVSLDSDS